MGGGRGGGVQSRALLALLFNWRIPVIRPLLAFNDNLKPFLTAAPVMKNEMTVSAIPKEQLILFPLGLKACQPSRGDEIVPSGGVDLHVLRAGLLGGGHLRLVGGPGYLSCPETDLEFMSRHQPPFNLLARAAA